MTAAVGSQRAVSWSTLTVTVRSVSGSALVMVTGIPSMADMPSASMAHIAYTVRPASRVTLWRVGTGENG
jgi:hypothetical protein